MIGAGSTYKSFETGWTKKRKKQKQKVSSASRTVRRASRESGPGPDSTFRTVGSQQCHKRAAESRHCAATAEENRGRGVGRNKCFFNWNSAVSSCFLPTLYESPRAHCLEVRLDVALAAPAN